MGTVKVLASYVVSGTAFVLLWCSLHCVTTVARTLTVPIQDIGVSQSYV
jgi:hypothetical protein